MNNFLIIALLCLFKSFCYSLTYKNISKNAHTKVLFDEGMLYYYAYSYSQAEHNFRMAIQFDNTCAPCYLALAMAKKQQAIELGKSFATSGLKEVQLAKNLLKKEQSFYYALAFALEKTFSENPTVNLNFLQKNLIEELKHIYNQYHNNHDWNSEALALLVDAIAYYPISDANNDNFHCSKKYEENLKREAIEYMQKSFYNRKYKIHPGILHTYIHMKETDLTDPHGMLAAKLLANFHNNYIAHYAHMPNHIYWRRGMYKDAIAANLNAIKFDENYFKKNGIGLSTYYYEYHYLHSQHFLTILGFLTNNLNLSLKNAREIKMLMDFNRMQDISDYRDIYLTLEHLLLARFENWQETISLPTTQKLGDLGILFLKFSQALSYLHLNNEKEYLNSFNEINKIAPEKKFITNIKNLIIVYLNAAKMIQNNLTFKEVENYIIQNNIKELEEIFHKNNPPLWIFPYSLLLANYANKRGDKNAAEKYFTLFLKQYPNATFGKLDFKS